VLLALRLKILLLGGRFGGKAALEEFTELRWVRMQRTPRQFPF
jgi:hypothetical protein